jgi:signal transduction histidine kinase
VNSRTAARIAWALVVLFVVLAAFAMWFQVQVEGWAGSADDLIFVPIFLSFGIMGALVVSSRPRNAVGWIFLGISVAAALAFFSNTYTRYSLGRSEPLPGTVWAGWLSSWLWLAFIAPTLTFLPLLFPDGRLPSRRWRPFAWVTGAFVLFAVSSFALEPGQLEDYPFRNPVGIPALEGVGPIVEGPAILVFVALALTCAASLFLRYRRAGREERQQIKWVAVSIGLLAVWFAISAVLEALQLSHPIVDSVAPAVAFASLPVGAGIGILRHRLFDVDIVINRALVFAVLAALITALYVGIVVGIGAFVGAGGNVFLSIVATALIAVAFQPLRERVRHFANRLVYGKRATPYELLSSLGERLSGAYSADDVLPRIARVMGEGTGAVSARVWLRVGDRLRLAARWPGSVSGGDSLPLRGDDLPAFPKGDVAFPVRHQGELLGAMTVTPSPREPLGPSQEKLLENLASQAGLILRNVRLIEELRASRQRLVAAQDEERRRIERNLHDGAQQQLVALSVKLRLAETIARKDPDKGADLVAEARGETQDALETLRDLARGIYPPLLADKGLPTALEAQARKSPVPVVLEPNRVGRYSPEVEATIYFCVLEALQNVAKYAEATSTVVGLAEENGSLTFTVSDDGRGFDPSITPKGSGLQNMADRVDSQGGEFEVHSVPAEGTTVTGRIPVTPSSDSFASA